MFRNIKLGPKILIAFLCVGLIPFAFIGVVSLTKSDKALTKQAFDQLESLREVKKSQIAQYFDARRTEMNSLIETVAVLKQAAFDKLVSVQENKKAQVENLFKEHNTNLAVFSKSTTVIDALKRFITAFGSEEAGKVGGEMYAYLETLFADSFRRFKEEYGYDDIYLIDQNGTIVYSVSHQADEGQNLLSGPLKDSPLAKSFQNGLKGIAIQDFEPYTISNNQYFAFLAAPVRDQLAGDTDSFVLTREASRVDTEGSQAAEAFGVVVLKINAEMLNTIVQRREGMGKTGETYIVGELDGTTSYRNDRVVKLGKIGQEKTGFDIENAFEGIAAQEVKIGSTGVMEITSYAPLEVPGLNWIMNTTMSLEEAIAPRLAEQDEDYFTRYIRQYGYSDLLLIHPTGKVFYSVAHEAEYGTNILTGDYSGTGVGKVVQTVLETKAFGFADFQPYAPAGGQPAAFIAQPVLGSNGGVELIVALRIPIDVVNHVMLERSGMGETGETYLVGPDMLMRSDSYLNPEQYSVVTSFANPEMGKVDTIASQEALSGNTGQKIIANYLGNRVLSAYTPLTIWDTTWALIAEIDEKEALAPVTDLTSLIGGMAILAIAAVIVFSWIFTGHITKPINQIVVVAQKISEGDLSAMLERIRTGHDEIGILIHAFQKVVVYFRDMADAAAKIATGDLSHKIAPRSDRDNLGHAFQKMSAYLSEIASVAATIAEGDLTARIPLHSGTDAFGQVIQAMTKGLRALIVQIRTSTDQIATTQKTISSLY